MDAGLIAQAAAIPRSVPLVFGLRQLRLLIPCCLVPLLNMHRQGASQAEVLHPAGDS